MSTDLPLYISCSQRKPRRSALKPLGTLVFDRQLVPRSYPLATENARAKSTLVPIFLDEVDESYLPTTFPISDDFGSPAKKKTKRPLSIIYFLCVHQHAFLLTFLLSLSLSPLLLFLSVCFRLFGSSSSSLLLLASCFFLFVFTFSTNTTHNNYNNNQQQPQTATNSFFFPFGSFSFLCCSLDVLLGLLTNICYFWFFGVIFFVCLFWVSIFTCRSRR